MLSSSKDLPLMPGSISSAHNRSLRLWHLNSLFFGNFWHFLIKNHVCMFRPNLLLFTCLVISSWPINLSCLEEPWQWESETAGKVPWLWPGNCGVHLSQTSSHSRHGSARLITHYYLSDCDRYTDYTLRQLNPFKPLLLVAELSPDFTVLTSLQSNGLAFLVHSFSKRD